MRPTAKLPLLFRIKHQFLKHMLLLDNHTQTIIHRTVIISSRDTQWLVHKELLNIHQRNTRGNMVRDLNPIKCSHHQVPKDMALMVISHPSNSNLCGKLLALNIIIDVFNFFKTDILGLIACRKYDLGFSWFFTTVGSSKFLNSIMVLSLTYF